MFGCGVEIGVGRGMWRSPLGMDFLRLGRIWAAMVAWVWATVVTVGFGFGHGFPAFGSDLGMGFRRLVKFLLIWETFCCDLLLVILLGMGLLEVEGEREEKDEK